MPTRKHRINLTLDDDLFIKVRRLAEEREWSLSHAVLHLLKFAFLYFDNRAIWLDRIDEIKSEEVQE